MKTRYVLGFFFSPDLSKVVLIKKAKPVWQAGKLNGVGGKIEDTDKTSHDAIEREFFEETDLYVTAADWRLFATLRFGDAEVDCFAASGPEISQVRTVTEETVDVYDLPLWGEHYFLPNLSWLIPMAAQAARRLDQFYDINCFYELGQ